MPPHNFSIGQNVEFVGSKYAAVPDGAYVVLRQLPNDGMDREYRVKNSLDGHERVVRQSQLRRGPPSFFK